MEDRLNGLSSTREHHPAPAPGIRWYASAAAVLAVVAAFRIALYLAREPFFDELFTIWAARRGFSGVLTALGYDSGPPLYYWIVRLLFGSFIDGGSGIAAVYSVRLLSMAAGVGAALAILLARRHGDARLAAAALLAVYPAHVYFSTEARAYALCALFAAIAMLALSSWVDCGERMRLAVAAIALLVAGYSHYYGVLLFALPLTAALFRRVTGAVRDAAAATVALGLAFIPGFLLAARQPAEATAWINDGGPALVVTSALRQFGFAGPFHRTFLAAPPEWLQWVSAAIVGAVLAAGVIRSREARIYGAMLAVPLLLAAGFGAAGRAVYFPTRFESVLAVPLVMALALSMATLPRILRAAAFAALAAIGAGVCLSAVVEHGPWTGDAYRQTAKLARQYIDDPDVTIVASGPQYLEILSQRDGRWSPRVLAYPSSQAEHPGWSAVHGQAALALEAASLPEAAGGRFVWAGAEGSPEMMALARRFRTAALFRRSPAVILLVSTDGMEDEQKEHHRHPADEEQPDSRAGS
jgi:hypothetical protein